jgi:Ion channel
MVLVPVVAIDLFPRASPSFSTTSKALACAPAAEAAAAALAECGRSRMWARSQAAHDPVMARSKRSLRTRWLRLFVPLGALAVLLGGGGLAAFEAEAARTYGDGVLWSLSLMTTVGFVGGVPTTLGGKIIAAVLMLLGFSFLAMTTAAVASLFVREDEAPFEAREHAYEREVLEELHELRARFDQMDAAFTRRPPPRAISR